MPSLVSLLAAAAAAAAAAQHASEARLLNMREVFTVEDYPLQSLRNEEQGTVEVKLRIDRRGLATSCTVTKSSGYPTLDEKTCTLLLARAKFEPARDRHGRLEESEFKQTISWRLADSAPMTLPRTEWTMRMTLGVASDGTPVTCKVEFTGSSAFPTDCGMPPFGPGAARRALGAPARYAINEIVFYPVDPDDAPDAPQLKDATMAARQVSQVTISPDGQIIACTPTVVAGPGGDKCGLLDLRFAPALQESGPTVGTLVQSEYVREGASN